MKVDLKRTRIGTAVVIAFFGGLLVAGAFDLTPFSHAQLQQQVNLKSNSPVLGQTNAAVDLGNSFAMIAETVTPAVVSIRASSIAPERVQGGRGRGGGPPTQNPPQGGLPRGLPPGWEDFFNSPGLPELDPEPAIATGTGFIVSSDGYILTNNHVVTKADRQVRQDRVTVALNDGRQFTAKVVGNDWETDVAVLKIDATGLPTVTLGDEAETRIGEFVLAIGNPLGLDFTVTAGIVSAKGRSANVNADRYAISDFIQTDAAINPGNSGGPLLNSRGEVIGINSAIASRTGYYQGYGFAIPITLARDIMSNLIEYGRIRASVLGVQIRNVEPKDAQVAGLKSVSGVLVSSFSPDSALSPAAKGGVQMGDVIVALNGRPIDHVGTLQRTVRSHTPGSTVDLDVMRYGKAHTLKVKLDERTPQPAIASAPVDVPIVPSGNVMQDKLGMTVQVASAGWLREQGVSAPEGFSGLRVTQISPNRQENGGLENAIITQVVYPGPAKDIKTEADLLAVLNRARDGDVITLKVRGVEADATGQQARLGQPFVVNVRVGSQQ